MTSQIISETIDSAYPVAGVDNDTQGFRDNFQIIKDGLGTAASEITELQQSTAKLDQDNNFNGSQIASALLKDIRHETSINGAPLLNSIEIDVSSAHYHRYVISADLQISISGWPEDSYAEVFLELTGTGADQDTDVRTVTLNTGATDFKTTVNWPDNIEVDEGTTDSHIIKLWSFNGGATVFATYEGKFLTNV